MSKAYVDHTHCVSNMENNQKIVINSRDKGYKVIMAMPFLKVTTAGMLLFLNGL